MDIVFNNKSDGSCRRQTDNETSSCQSNKEKFTKLGVVYTFSNKETLYKKPQSGEWHSISAVQCDGGGGHRWVLTILPSGAVPVQLTVDDVKPVHGPLTPPCGPCVVPCDFYKYRLTPDCPLCSIKQLCSALTAKCTLTC